MGRYLTIVFVLACSGASGQDLSTLGKNKPFDYGGSLSINQRSAYRQTGRYVPYAMYISGRANLSVYGIALPFSFSYTNQRISYSQPFSFNRFGAQPSYKWVKAYVGYNSMTFSPYSLSGHQFLGAGLELTPPQSGLKFSAMYGRLVKRVEWDSLLVGQRPYYERYGYAAKLGYSNSDTQVEVGLFKAWDLKHSLSNLPDSLGIQPKDNMVYTVTLGKTVLGRVKLSGEFAASSLTRDTRQSASDVVAARRIFFLVRPNGTTTYSKAAKGSVEYLGDEYTIGVVYERVDPGYSTLGAYYVNNDFENYALTFSRQLLQGKLNLSGNLGMQHNNLDGDKMASSENILGSFNITCTPGERVNLSASYTNQSYYTYIRTLFDRVNSTSPYQNIDTLNFSQISQSATLSGSMVLGSIQDKERRQQLSFNLSYQESVNRQGGSTQPGGSSNYQGSAMYTYTLLPVNLSLTGSLLGSYSKINPTDGMLMCGPVIGITKSFLNKRLSSTTSIAYNASYRNRTFTGDVFSFRIGAGFTHQKTHRVNLNLCLVCRNNAVALAHRHTVEFVGNLNYTYTLSKD